MTLTRVLRIIGTSLVGIGVLLLLFTAFQLWGTGIFEARSQSALRTQINHELPRGAAASAGRATPTSYPTAGGTQTAPTSSDPPIGKPVGVIQIPAIGVNQVIVEGVSDTQLAEGPGHYPGTPLPGQAGNAAIAGHRTTYAHPFYELNVVKAGDRIIITTPQGIFTYRAISQHSVSPADVAVLNPSLAPILTLTTCTPRSSAAQRLILVARLAASRLFTGGAISATTPTAPPTPATAQALAGDSTGAWVSPLLWGLLATVVGVGTVLVARLARRRRVLAYAGGTVVFLFVLFFFFASIDPLLPASF